MSRASTYTLNPAWPLIGVAEALLLGNNPNAAIHYDDSPNDNQLTLNGMEAGDWSLDGTLDRQALAFDGTSAEYGRRATPSLLPGNCDFTVAFWASPTSATLKNIFRWGEDDLNPCVLVQMSTVGIALYISGITANRYKVSGMSLSGWHHHAFAKLYGDAYAAYYLDGGPTALTGGAAAANVNVSSTSAILEVGGKSTGLYPSYFPGSMSDVMFFSSAVSQSNLAELATPSNYRLIVDGVAGIPAGGRRRRLIICGGA